MSGLVLTNTLTGKREPFVPMTAGKAGLYVCGITPYDESHIGHARCYVVFDLLKRVLLKEGLQVTHVQNFTDVDDKIIKRANEAGVSPLGYPQKFMDSFKAYMNALNVLPADKYPLVTTHMPDIVALIEKLIARGFAYALDGDVYYSVRKFGDDYGRLSKRNIDDLESGARVSVDERKRDPLDFALWKKSKPDEPAWTSPWGEGRPGWHIECSAMSMKYLGEEFDIHGGGMDLIFPHHTNEIAQSTGATGKPFARLWVHNGFVTVDNEKMSKSLGNFFTIKDILAKFDAMTVRYFLLSQHHRSPLNFSDQALKVAETTWHQRALGAYRVLQEAGVKPGAVADAAPLLEDFRAALLNDLNAPAALAELNNVCSTIFGSLANKDQAKLPVLFAALNEMFEWLGFKPVLDENWSEEILALARARDEARKAKQWAKSDELRNALKQKGVVVEDTPSGFRLKKA
jgi:cysteinyl-tRNA synthetase